MPDIEELENTYHTAQSVQNLGIPAIQFGITPSRVTTYPTDQTLRNEGQPADAKVCGDKFDDDEADISLLFTKVGSLETATETMVTTSMIDTTLAESGKVADAGATGTAIATAVAGAVFSVEGITPDLTTHNVSLETLLATTAEVQTAIDQMLAGQ